jgi:hypothetical protein
MNGKRVVSDGDYSTLLGAAAIYPVLSKPGRKGHKMVISL